MPCRLPMHFHIVDHPEDDRVLSALDRQAVHNVNMAATAAIKARKTTIQLIRATAREVDRVTKHKNNTAIAGRALSIIGSAVAGIAGGVVTVVTAGAAAVPVAAVLLGCGAGVGVIGGITNVVGGYVCSKKQDNLLEELRKTIEEDQKAHCGLADLLDMFREPKFASTEFRMFSAGLGAGIGAANTFAYIEGGAALITVLSAGLPLLSQHIKDPGIRKLLGSPVVTLLLPLLIDSLQVTAETGVSVADDIALGAVSTMVEGPTKKVAFTAAKKAAQAVIQEAGDDAASAAVKAAATAAAKEATQSAVKLMARITGGLTIGLGVLMIAWDIYWMYEECEEMRKKEKLGDALRRLAKSLEEVGSSCEELFVQSGY